MVEELVIYGTSHSLIRKLFFELLYSMITYDWDTALDNLCLCYQVNNRAKVHQFDDPIDHQVDKANPEL